MAVKKKQDVNEIKPNEIYNPEEFCEICGRHISENCEHLQAKEKIIEDEYKKEVDEQSDPVMEAFELLDDAPTKELIDSWKETYGKVYLTMLDDDRAFIYRRLKRGEWKALRARNLNDITMEEEIFKLAVIWPKKAIVAEYNAGEISTVSSLILRMSGFMNPEEAAIFTREL